MTHKTNITTGTKNGARPFHHCYIIPVGLVFGEQTKPLSEQHRRWYNYREQVSLVGRPFTFSYNFPTKGGNYNRSSENLCRVSARGNGHVP